MLQGYGPKPWTAIRNFGLTPVEAMASGLPVVVSDWNGYRDTVVEGRIGYRVTTHSFQPGWNNINLRQMALRGPALDQVSARISGQIGVDAIGAGSALAHLANSPQLAVAMGALGMQHVERNYDWQIVLKEYSNLLDDLADRRQHASNSVKHANLASMKPIPALPQVFKSWPSQVIDKNSSLQACGNQSDLINHLQLNGSNYLSELPPTTLILKAFTHLQRQRRLPSRALDDKRLTGQQKSSSNLPRHWLV